MAEAVRPKAKSRKNKERKTKRSDPETEVTFSSENSGITAFDTGTLQLTDQTIKPCEADTETERSGEDGINTAPANEEVDLCEPKRKLSGEELNTGEDSCLPDNVDNLAELCDKPCNQAECGVVEHVSDVTSKEETVSDSDMSVTITDNQTPEDGVKASEELSTQEESAKQYVPEQVMSGAQDASPDDQAAEEVSEDSFELNLENLPCTDGNHVQPGWLALSDYTMTPVIDNEEDPLSMIDLQDFHGNVNERGLKLAEKNSAPCQVMEVEASKSEQLENAVTTQSLLKTQEQMFEVQTLGTRITPFSEEELKMFYFNSELQHVEEFVDQFIENSQIPKSDFCELVDAYMKSRLSQVQLKSDIKNLQQSCKEILVGVWKAKQESVTIEGKCADGFKTSKVFMYELAEFYPDVLIQLSSKLKEIRTILYQEYQLKAYNSQMARIRIESFLHDVFASSPILLNVSTEYPVTAKLPQQLLQEDLATLETLQNCISVLFTFKRVGNIETEFSKDVDEWLERLVGVLQRVGALPDHFFIVNHLLRCPPGSIALLSPFLQFPVFQLSQEHYQVWDSPLLHHFTIMLANLTLPVKSRKEFLAKYKDNLKPSTGRSISWLLVDEEREEDESPEESWCLLHENDLTTVLEQFPFEKLLQFLLKIRDENGTLQYDITSSTSSDIMHLLAFGTCMVKLLGEVFETYNLIRYRQFLKRISRTIRLIVQVISDHWCQYRTWRAELCGDSYQDVPQFMTLTPQFHLARLQLEFDEFFLKSTKGILESHSFGVCQFLSCMPYDAISLEAAWAVLSMLTGERIGNNLTAIQFQNIPSVSSRIGQTPPAADTIFLLTALSNLAMARPPEDKEFLEASVERIFQISFLSEATKDLCLKTGRDLISSVADKHSFIMSYLLLQTERHMEKLDKDAVYLFKGLPLEFWKPSASDMELIRSWLLKQPLTSVPHALGRYILSNLNYGTVIQEGRTELFLDRGFHCAVAITLVEVVGFCLPDRPGGIKDLQCGPEDILSQVSRLAYMSYNRLVNAQVQDELINWAFETVLKLRIHGTDITYIDAASERSKMLISIEEASREEHTHDSWFSKVSKAFTNIQARDVDLATTAELLNVHIAVQSHGMLAYYTVLGLTREGHLFDAFLGAGVDKLLAIIRSGYIDAGLRVIGSVFPIIIDRPDVLKTSEKFLQVLDTLVHCDANRAGYTEKLWQYLEPGVYSHKLASVILNTIVPYSDVDKETSLNVIDVWLQLLVQLPNWPKDCCVQFLLDNIIKMAFSLEGGMDRVTDVLNFEFKKMMDGSSSKSFLTSFLSWISNPQTSTPLSVSCHPEYTYYAYAALSMETAVEEESGLWRELASEMIFNTKTPVETAYKKAIANTKSPYLPQLVSLSIYRWAEQAMATSNDHPLLPIIWQQFFRLFLQKPSEDSGLSDRVGIGYRFFRNFNYSSMAKKMKSQLYATASYHQERSHRRPAASGESSNQESFKEHTYSESFHNELSSMYITLGLWLDEPRLHDPMLLLSALPTAYSPDLLQSVFSGTKSPWMQFVSSQNITKEIDALRSLWTNEIRPGRKLRMTLGSEDALTRQTKSLNILRILSAEQCAKPPPPVATIASPVPEINPQLLLTRPRLVQELSSELERVVQHSKRVSSLLASHVGLDEEYNELVPDLYHNVPVQRSVEVPCGEKLNRCKGPARIVCRFQEKALNNRIFASLQDNRTEWEGLIKDGLQPSPHNLCTGAVYVENVITQLLKTLQYANEQQRVTLYDAGTRLFYLLADLIDNDVKRCNPAIQFFSSCVQKLGEAFIAGNSAEQLRLLQTTLSKEPSVSFLAPHFTPNGQGSMFVDLYKELTDSIAPEKITTIFVILSKFDMAQCLLSNPNLSDREIMLKSTLRGIATFGLTPPDNVLLVADKLRYFFLLLLRHRFPELYFCTLDYMLRLAIQSALWPIVWSDFVFSIGGTLQGHLLPISVPREQTAYLEIEETIERLNSFLYETLTVSNRSIVTFYRTWSPYIPSFAALYTFLLTRMIQNECSQVHNMGDVERIQKCIWTKIKDAYAIWILPKKGEVAWLYEMRQEATLMIHSFVEVSTQASERLSSMGTNALLNDLWTFYCEEIVSKFKDKDGAIDLYNSLFLTLPWKYYYPTIKNFALQLELFKECNSGFHFLSKVLYNVNWSSVLSSLAMTDEVATQHVLDFLYHLLKIIVMMTCDTNLMKTTKDKYFAVLNMVHAAPWYLLEARQVEMTSIWLSENCDSTELLVDTSPVVCLLKLLKNLCGFQRKSLPDLGHDYSGKRISYVRTIITLLTRCSTLSKSQPNSFRLVINRLLNDIDLSFTNDEESVKQELMAICTTVLGMLNNFPPGPGLEVIRCTLQDYMSQTTHSEIVFVFISAASVAVANLNYMSTVLECAIEGIFTRLSDQELVTAWSSVSSRISIPELDKEEFLKETLKSGNLLLLFAYNRKRLCNSELTFAVELNALIETVQWCSQLSNHLSSESKVVLLFHQALQIVNSAVEKATTDVHFQQIAKYILFLCHACQEICEEKFYHGLLGMLGLGKKSQLSPSLRLYTRSVQTFLLAQIPSSGVALRTSAESPGAVRGAGRTTTTDAEKSLTYLETLSKNRQYTALRTQIQWAVQFISDPQHCIKDAHCLSAHLIKELFYRSNAVIAAVT